MPNRFSSQRLTVISFLRRACRLAGAVVMFWIILSAEMIHRGRREYVEEQAF
jgi:hypothetical protein